MENEQVVETAATESTTTESSPEVGGQEVEAHTGEPVEHDAPERVEAEAGEDGGASDEPSYTLRVDGRDIDVPLSELKRGYGHHKAATQRFEEAAALRREAETLQKNNSEVLEELQGFFESMRQDPLLVLRNVPGVDVEAAIQNEIAKALMLDDMSEDERRLYEARQEAEAIEARNKQYYERQQQEKEQAEIAEYQSQLAGWINDSVAQTSLPQSPTAMNMLRSEIEAFWNAGYTVGPEEVQKAAQKVSGEISQLLQNLQPTSPIAQTPPPAPARKGKIQTKKSTEKKEKTISGDEFFKNLSQKYNLI